MHCEHVSALLSNVSGSQYFSTISCLTEFSSTEVTIKTCLVEFCQNPTFSQVSFSHTRDISMRCILFATVGSTLFNPMVRCDCTAVVLRCFDWTPLHVQLLSLPTDTPLSLRPGSSLTWLSLEQASRLCLMTSSSHWRCVHC